MKQILSQKNKVLLAELVRTDFKLRYQGSVLGYTWSFLRPLFLFGILYVVFGQILRFGQGIPNYSVYLLLGIVLWSFFTESTKQGSSAIIARGALLRKINFPKYIVVISATMSALINLLLNLLIVFIFILISGAEVQPWAILLVPVLIIELYTLSLAVSFFLAAINVKYRDVQHIWDIIMQAGFYATPIIYPLTLVIAKSESLALWLLALNPMAQIIQDMRALLTTSETITLTSISNEPLFYLIPFGMIAVISVLAVKYFKKESKYFAEDL